MTSNPYSVSFASAEVVSEPAEPTSSLHQMTPRPSGFAPGTLADGVCTYSPLLKAPPRISEACPLQPLPSRSLSHNLADNSKRGCLKSNRKMLTFPAQVPDLTLFNPFYPWMRASLVLPGILRGSRLRISVPSRFSRLSRLSRTVTKSHEKSRNFREGRRAGRSTPPGRVAQDTGTLTPVGTRGGKP